jgi:hypothetical protein
MLEAFANVSKLARRRRQATSLTRSKHKAIDTSCEGKVVWLVDIDLTLHKSSADKLASVVSVTDQGGRNSYPKKKFVLRLL